MKFLLTRGAMYRVYNGNLLFHGCIPMEEDGTLQAVQIGEQAYSGKALLDQLNILVNQAYFLKEDEPEKEYACD